MNPLTVDDLRLIEEALAELLVRAVAPERPKVQAVFAKVYQNRRALELCCPTCGQDFKDELERKYHLEFWANEKKRQEGRVES